MRACIQNVRMRPNGASGVLFFNGVKVPLSVVLSPADMKRAKLMAHKALTKYRDQLISGIRANAPVSGDEVGFFKKIFRKVKKAVKKVTPKFVRKAVNKLARTKLGRFAVKKAGELLRFAKKVGVTMKKIAQHPAFQATVFAVSQIVPGAQALGVVYVAAMTAIRVAEGLAKKDPQAITALANYATAAASGDPKSAEIMGRFDAIKNIASAKSPMDAITATAGAIKGVPGIGDMPAELGIALKVADGLGRKDPQAVSAIAGYATAAAKGHPNAAKVVDAFKAVKSMGKTPPDIQRMLKAAAEGAKQKNAA